MESINDQQIFQIAEVQLVYKSNVKPSLRPKVTASQEAHQLFKANWDDSRIELVEQFKVMLLNRANKMLGIYDLSTGGITGTVADPKLIFIAALKAAATSIIIAHNHPSGNLKPSQADLELTRKLKEGGKLLDIQVLDHLILTSEKYYSLSDEGLM